jgi:hypothetical protein
MRRYPYHIAFLAIAVTFDLEVEVVHECTSLTVPWFTPKEWALMRHGTLAPFGYKKNTFWNRLMLRLGKSPNEL